MTLFNPPENRTLTLRPYQEEAIASLREALRNGNRKVILCAPTGSGKTEMAIHLIQQAAQKDSHIAFVTDRITLVQQTSARLSEYGMIHGIAQATNTIGRRERIQICSAQTVEKRGYWPQLDLLIIDECHTQRQAMQQFADSCNVPVIGLSATPLTPGLGDHWDTVVNAATTDELLAAGYLAPLKPYAATEINMAGAKKKAGEWQASEVRNRGKVIIGDIVSEWARLTAKHFGGPVKTLVFSADVAHGDDLCRAFQAAGYDFRQSTFRDSDSTTSAMVEAFRQSRFTGLVSVEKFVKGFDVPDVLCMIGARPYAKSLASFIQQLGRGMRTAQGKEYCLYIDHAGNMEGFYDQVCEVWAEGVHTLHTATEKCQRKEGAERTPTVCAECQYIFPAGAEYCPSCGAQRPRKQTHATVLPGQMTEVKKPQRRKRQPLPLEDREWGWQQLSAIALYRKQGDTTAAQRHVKWLYKLCYGGWPPKDKTLTPSNAIEPDVDQYVRHCIIREVKKAKGRWWKL